MGAVEDEETFRAAWIVVHIVVLLLYEETTETSREVGKQADDHGLDDDILSFGSGPEKGARTTGALDRVHPCCHVAAFSSERIRRDSVCCEYNRDAHQEAGRSSSQHGHPREDANARASPLHGTLGPDVRGEVRKEAGVAMSLTRSYALRRMSTAGRTS